jgi:hypothetical protein
MFRDASSVLALALLLCSVLSAFWACEEPVPAARRRPASG